MVIDSSNIFNFQEIIMNELIGDVWITVIIGLLVVFLLATKARMPYEMFMLFGGLYLLIMFEITKFEVIYAIVVFVITTFFYYVVNKAFQRV